MIAEKYINPFTDFGRLVARFKKIFGEEANKDLFIGCANVSVLTDNSTKNLKII